ncbi:MAG: hypothetical protein K8S98_02440 [Planctomycetes bacterium]|nr:hypothetical protein [Planctomycetota bacterium]
MTSSTSDASTPATMKSSSIDLTLLQKIVAAPTTVSWRGRRHFEAHYTFKGAPVDLVYEETLTTDGTGRYQLAAEDLIVPTLPAGNEALFLLTQDNREGLMFQHRDPTVRDATLFLNNYTAIDAGTTEQVVGRNCARWSVQANAGGNTWTLWIDLATGVILKSEERDGGQALIALLQYLDFTDAPDTSNAVWHNSVLQESTVPTGQAQAVLGFAPISPRMLPPNYRLARTERVVDPVENRTWARFTYTDGWNEVIFMDGGAVNGSIAIHGPAPQPDVIRITEVGPWSIADGRIASHRVLAASRGGESDLKLLIESSLP